VISAESIATLAIILQGIAILGGALYALWMKTIAESVKKLEHEMSDLRVKVAAYTGDSNGGGK